MSATTDIYAKVTASIVAALENGVAPWQKPWRGGRALPTANLISKKPYRGVNVLLTNMAPYASRWWMTFNQAKSLGGSVRKGEKGTTIVYWHVSERPQVNASGVEEVKKTFLLRYFTIFNLEQTEGIPADSVPNEPVERVSEFEAWQHSESVISRYLGNQGPTRTIVPGCDRAYYTPSLDAIVHPAPEQFVGQSAYYSTVFHELAHSTGHKTRLDRDLGGHFGSQDYSFEELIAELGAAFLCGATGLEPTVDQSAAYLQSWAAKLKDNPDWIVKAASKAQRAAECVLGVSAATAAVTEDAEEATTA